MLPTISLCYNFEGTGKTAEGAVFAFLPFSLYPCFPGTSKHHSGAGATKIKMT